MIVSALHFSRVVIVGVGLIGGSLALALKRAGVVGTVVGVGRSAASLQKALDLGVMVRGESHPLVGNDYANLARWQYDSVARSGRRPMRPPGEYASSFRTFLLAV